MSLKTRHLPPPNRRRNVTPSRRRQQPKKSRTALYAALAAAGLVALVAVIVLLVSGDNGYKFSRADLDLYVKSTEPQKPVMTNPGAAVYIDMSDGMINAFKTPEGDAILPALINKFAADGAVSFYSLASGQITPVQLPHAQLYQYMLNPANSKNWAAPVESALERIVSREQPALLMTDFEEYNNGVIYPAAYAKRYFIEWLAKGYNIYFYRWDFVEKGKEKKMFLAVFDDNANRLKGMVDSAIAIAGQQLPEYTLAGHWFSYPMQQMYANGGDLKKGGSYHKTEKDGSVGADVVTAVIEKGGAQDYISYATPYATADGSRYANLDWLVGSYAEYYPLGVSWADAVNNARNMQQPGVKQPYEHFVDGLAVDLGAQSGYDIDGIEVRTFDLQPTVETLVSMPADSIDIDVLSAVGKPEINMVLTATMRQADGYQPGVNIISVDFDEHFTGTFAGGRPSTDLLQANIVISKATANLAQADEYFSWPGNPCLANSVKETLTAPTSSPVGRILYTYYFKTLAE